MSLLQTNPIKSSTTDKLQAMVQVPSLVDTNSIDGRQAVYRSVTYLNGVDSNANAPDESSDCTTVVMKMERLESEYKQERFRMHVASFGSPISIKDTDKVKEGRDMYNNMPAELKNVPTVVRDFVKVTSAQNSLMSLLAAIEVFKSEVSKIPNIITSIHKPILEFTRAMLGSLPPESLIVVGGEIERLNISELAFRNLPNTVQIAHFSTVVNTLAGTLHHELSITQFHEALTYHNNMNPQTKLDSALAKNKLDQTSVGWNEANNVAKSMAKEYDDKNNLIFGSKVTFTKLDEADVNKALTQLSSLSLFAQKHVQTKHLVQHVEKQVAHAVNRDSVAIVDAKIVAQHVITPPTASTLINASGVLYSDTVKAIRAAVESLSVTQKPLLTRTELLFQMEQLIDNAQCAIKAAALDTESAALPMPSAIVLADEASINALVLKYNASLVKVQKQMLKSDVLLKAHDTVQALVYVKTKTDFEAALLEESIFKKVDAARVTGVGTLIALYGKLNATDRVAVSEKSKEKISTLEARVSAYTIDTSINANHVLKVALDVLDYSHANFLVNSNAFSNAVTTVRQGYNASSKLAQSFVTEYLVLVSQEEYCKALIIAQTIIRVKDDNADSMQVRALAFRDIQIASQKYNEASTAVQSVVKNYSELVEKTNSLQRKTDLDNVRGFTDLYVEFKSTYKTPWFNNGTYTDTDSEMTNKMLEHWGLMNNAYLLIPSDKKQIYINAHLHQDMKDLAHYVKSIGDRNDAHKLNKDIDKHFGGISYSPGLDDTIDSHHGQYEGLSELMKSYIRNYKYLEHMKAARRKYIAKRNADIFDAKVNDISTNVGTIPIIELGKRITDADVFYQTLSADAQKETVNYKSFSVLMNDFNDNLNKTKALDFTKLIEAFELSFPCDHIRVHYPAGSSYGGLSVGVSSSGVVASSVGVGVGACNIVHPSTLPGEYERNFKSELSRLLGINATLTISQKNMVPKTKLDIFNSHVLYGC